MELVRRVVDGGKISYKGREFEIPWPGSDAVPMRLSMRAEHEIPIYLATLSPAMLKLTGEIADGWLGTSFVPEGAGPAYFTHLDEGLARSGRSRSDLDVCQGVEVAFAPDEDALREMVSGRGKELAFSLGGMGSASTNFYNQAYSRQGWADIACEVCERWQAGDRDGAASLVTDEMVLATTLIGTESMVRQRLGVWRDAGVDTVRLYPAGTTLDDRLATLGRPSKSCMRSAILREPHQSPNATRGTQPGISRMLWAISSVRRGAAPSSLPCGSTAEGPRDRVPAAPRYAGDSRRRR